MALVAALSCSSASAQSQWAAVSQNNESMLYVDWAGLRAEPTGQWRLWSLRDYYQPRQGEDIQGIYRSQKVLFRLDCGQQRPLQVLSTAFYEGGMGAGRVVAMSSEPSDPFAVVPGTMSANVHALVCK